jgi:hypothetical protein
MIIRPYLALDNGDWSICELMLSIQDGDTRIRTNIFVGKLVRQSHTLGLMLA